jgi:hypothetical protein
MGGILPRTIEVVYRFGGLLGKNEEQEKEAKKKITQRR